MQGFPAVAGALAQLVQLDLAAAEMSLLTLLSQPTMARAMGAAAARRARDLFAPEVVMSAHEALFAELEQLRLSAPASSHCPRPVSPQLDPVRVFTRYASHSPAATETTRGSIHSLPDPVLQQRAALWRILEQSVPNSERSRLMRDLGCKHQQYWSVDQEAYQ